MYIDLIGGRVKAENPNAPGRFEDPMDAIRYLIRDRGLRAQLATESMVTGKLYVALDFLPNSPIRLIGHDDLLEIPTVPSKIEQLMEQLEGLRLKEFVENLTKLIDHVDELVTSPEVTSSLENLDGLLAELRTLTRNVDAEVKPLSTTAQDTLTEYQALAAEAREKLDPLTEAALAALEQTEATLATFQETLDPDSELRYKTSQVLDEVSQAARALRLLADYLERHPEALLRGKK